MFVSGVMRMTETITGLGTVLVDECRLDIDRLWLEGGSLKIAASGTWTVSEKKPGKLAGVVVFGPDGVHLRADPAMPVEILNARSVRPGDWVTLDLDVWFLPDD